MTTKENTRTIKVKCTLYIPVVVPNDPDLDWELCIEERGCPGTGRVGDAIKEYIEKCEKEGVCWGCPGRNEIMEAAECAPVQPAPAEKEEEWWEDRQKFWREDRHLGGPECPTPLLEKIVAEAKRRGAQEAWKEAKKIIETLKPKDPGGVGKGADKKYWWDHGWDVGARNLCIYASKEINAKLESLNKPVTGK